MNSTTGNSNTGLHTQVAGWPAKKPEGAHNDREYNIRHRDKLAEVL